jgi:pimeloyl-ACP methyl ester carboxylesterase
MQAMIDGIPFYVEEAGTGFPLVMVHAGIADHRMWDPQWDHFAQDYRVVRYDLRGFGQTAPGQGDVYRHRHLRDLLIHLGIEKAHMMGCSMGGQTVIDFALENPGMVQSMVLVCTALSGFDYPNPSPLEEEAEKAFEAGNLREAAEIEAQLWVVGRDRSREEVDASIFDRVVEMNLLAYSYEEQWLADIQNHKADPPAVGRVMDMQAPTLVVSGQYDEPDIHTIEELLVAELPDVQRVTLPAAHLPNMERPAEFNAAVGEFLAAQSGG